MIPEDAGSPVPARGGAGPAALRLGGRIQVRMVSSRSVVVLVSTTVMGPGAGWVAVGALGPLGGDVVPGDLSDAVLGFDRGVEAIDGLVDGGDAVGGDDGGGDGHDVSPFGALPVSAGNLNR